MVWLDLLAVQGTRKSLLQHHRFKRIDSAINRHVWGSELRTFILKIINIIHVRDLYFTLTSRNKKPEFRVEGAKQIYTISPPRITWHFLDDLAPRTFVI